MSLPSLQFFTCWQNGIRQLEQVDYNAIYFNIPLCMPTTLLTKNENKWIRPLRLVLFADALLPNLTSYNILETANFIDKWQIDLFLNIEAAWSILSPPFDQNRSIISFCAHDKFSTTNLLIPLCHVYNMFMEKRMERLLNYFEYIDMSKILYEIHCDDDTFLTNTNIDNCLEIYFE